MMIKLRNFQKRRNTWQKNSTNRWWRTANLRKRFEKLPITKLQWTWTIKAEWAWIRVKGLMWLLKNLSIAVFIHKFKSLKNQTRSLRRKITDYDLTFLWFHRKLKDIMWFWLSRKAYNKGRKPKAKTLKLLDLLELPWKTKLKNYQHKISD